MAQFPVISHAQDGGASATGVIIFGVSFSVSDFIALAGVLISMAAFWVSVLTKSHTSKSSLATLHSLWENKKDINPVQPITTDVLNGIRALKFTSEMWKENLIKKKMLYRYSGEDYKKLYESIDSCVVEVPATGVTGKSMLTKSVRETYKDIVNSNYKE